jgi:hypothetical protein
LNLVFIFLSTPKTYTFDLDIPNISFIPPLPKLDPPLVPEEGLGPFPCKVLYIYTSNAKKATPTRKSNG